MLPSQKIGQFAEQENYSFSLCVFIGIDVIFQLIKTAPNIQADLRIYVSRAVEAFQIKDGLET